MPSMEMKLPTRFTSWIAVYRSIKNAGLENETTVVFDRVDIRSLQGRFKIDVQKYNVAEIKSKALDELLMALPEEETLRSLIKYTKDDRARGYFEVPDTASNQLEHLYNVCSFHLC